MGFFSFGKKKKNDAQKTQSTVPPPSTTTPTLAKGHLRRPSRPINSASASSSLSAVSSGSSSGSPPQPRHSQTFATPQRSLSFSPDTLAVPVPRIPGSRSQSTSASSLNAPIAPYANRDLSKKGSTNTLNSMKSTSSKRGAHEAPRVAPDLAALKPRAYSYHASQVRNIWVTSASDAGHSTVQSHGNTKYHSTGSPGVMNRGSSYFNGQQSLPQGQHRAASDEDFKSYAKKYDMTIARAHTLAREYHHLPPSKRDRARFEHIGKAFAAAARISRDQWSHRCKLEKERLEALLAQGAVDLSGEETSTHTVAGARASEGWQYASMLADAWGMKEEMAEPLEDMPVLKPTYLASSYQFDRGYSDRGTSAYLHPGYTQSGYASYISQQGSSELAHPRTTAASQRDRMDSNASAAPSLDSYAQSSSSHTHSGVSHTLKHSQSHQTFTGVTPAPASTPATVGATATASSFKQSGYLPSPLKSTTLDSPKASPSRVEEPATRAPIVLSKGRRYRERGSSLASVPVTVS